MWYKNVGTSLKFLSFCHKACVWQTNRQTEGRTERPWQYRALHNMQLHGKNYLSEILTTSDLDLWLWKLLKMMVVHMICASHGQSLIIIMTSYDTQFLSNTANSDTTIPDTLLHQLQARSIVFHKSKIIVRTHIQCQRCLPCKPEHKWHRGTVRNDHCKQHAETDMLHTYQQTKRKLLLLAAEFPSYYIKYDEYVNKLQLHITHSTY